ncbi:MAG: IS1634 family transposase, partial [Thermoplasmata archaeon]
MDAKEIIELYKKRGRIEQCFRTINVLYIASPIYHFTPEKIRVHMFFSLLAYLFLALLYNKLKEIEGISLVNVPEYLSNIRAIYIISGNVIKRKIDSKDPISRKIVEILDLEKMI